MIDIEEFEGEMHIKLKGGSGEVSVKVENGGVQCFSLIAAEAIIAFHDWLSKNTELSEEEIKAKFHELIDIAVCLRAARQHAKVLKELKDELKNMEKNSITSPDEFVESTDVFIKILEAVRDIAKKEARNGQH